MKLRALHNGLIVRPLEKTNSKGYVEESTSWGFEIQADKNGQGQGNGAFERTISRAHWAEVLVIGDECEEIEVGDFVCIEPQMWTNTFELDGITARKTDESKIIAVQKEEPNLFI